MPGPNTQNQYSATPVPLDGGLDLINPKITINAGGLSACLNVERTDRVGYSRIKGFEPFDGGMSPSLSYTNAVWLIHDTQATAISPRNELYTLNPDESLQFLLGCVIFHTPTRTLVAITDFDQWHYVRVNVQAGNDVKMRSESLVNLNVTDIQSFATGQTQVSGTAVDAKSDVLARNSYFKGMSALVTSPGLDTTPVFGLAGFKDQIYAVKDLRTTYFTNGEARVYPNDIVFPHGDSGLTRAIRVLDIKILTGSWDTADATGIILFESGTPVLATVYDIHRPTPVAGAFVMAAAPDDVDMSPWQATMYESATIAQATASGLARGWNAILQGYTTSFDEGQSAGPFRVARRGKFSDFDTDVQTGTGPAQNGSTSDSEAGGTPITQETWTLTGGATVYDILNANTPGHSVRRHFNSSTPFDQYTPGNLYLSDFAAFSGFATSDSITIEGVEVVVVAHPQIENTSVRTFSIAVQPVTGDTTLQVGTSPQTQNLEVNFAGSTQAVQTLTYGGPTDLWGLSADDMKAGMDSGWGMAIQPFINLSGDGLRIGDIDLLYVRINVYYKAKVTNYYFWNGTDDVTADITSYFQFTTGDADGTDWATNDAQGTLQITNIEPVGGSERSYVMDNDQIRTDMGGGGLLIATVNGDMAYNGLDTLAEIEAAGSRYEFITENFYADKDFEGLYGVSGAGRAFSWDGFYFTRIFTQEDESKDIPRHLTAHQFHLVLGYEAGANLFSVAGNPLDFSGLNGATEIDTGDSVVGYSTMQGTTLSIFGKKSIKGLVGTSPDNFSLSILSPDEGAIEYTVKNAGSITLFLSYRGITRFEQTAAYGDFSGQRLSYLVSPFLIPRIQGSIAPLDGQAASNGPLVAYVCRTTNQYNLVFKDGYVLSMTLSGSDETPMFTIRAPQLFNTTTNAFQGYFVPRAESSFVDSMGAERIHMAPYSIFLPQDKYRVYEFEKGWTFNGYGIPAYFVTSENFYGQITDIDNPRKLRLHGLSQGYAPLFVRLGKDYEPNDNVVQVPRECLDCSLPRTQLIKNLLNDLEPVTNIVDPAKRGRSFSMRFMSYDFTAQPPSVDGDPILADVCPPFVVQAMLPQYTENKGDV